MIIKRIYKAIKYRIDRYRYASAPRRKRLVDNYLNTHSVRKLQIGCGRNMLSGWLNTDASLKICQKGAVYMNAGEPFPLPDASIDYVFSEHLFEHLTYPQAVNMLSECHRVLKPHGVIRIATPNLQFLLDLYQHPERPINKRFIEWSAGGGAGGGVFPASSVYIISKYHTAWGHKIIYDAETLTILLRENGFDDVCQCEIGNSKHDALKNVEGHHVNSQTSFEFCELQTMILEATNNE